MGVERETLKGWPGPNRYSIRCQCKTVWFPPITSLLDECPHCGYDWTQIPVKGAAHSDGTADVDK